MVSAFLFLLSAVPAGSDIEVPAVLREVCTDCHAGKRARGGFDVAALFAERPLATGLFDWRLARGMVETGSMPPRVEGEVALTDGERDALLEFFAAVETQAQDLGGSPGHAAVRRLTRGELAHALRELFGVEVDVEALLPEELLAENGFETNGATLFLHTDWFERAGLAIEIALGQALPEDPSAHVRPELEPSSFDTARMLRRIYRRPATTEELERFAQARAKRLAQGKEPRTALRETLADTLASPHFLMRLEDVVSTSTAREGTRPVSAYGVASRLSFMLWSAPPDETLLDLADGGRLLEPEVLQAQVDRLLDDPRSESFGETFAGPWFGTHELGTRFKPDPIDNPRMTDSLLLAMRSEVALFVRSLFLEGSALDDFLRGNHSFVNAELARYYHIAGVEGEHMRRVRLVDSRRRGILGKAGVLAITSYPYRTSPVLRGAFILDDILGTPPPPPPPGASDVDEDELQRVGARGTRGRLEAHRARAECASCHARIDPLGFALEGFDRHGRTRRRYASGLRVDTRASLPDGTEFQGPTALGRILLERHREELSREIARRLLRYALGRSLHWYDERTVFELARVLEEEGFRALLHAVVASRPFLEIEREDDALPETEPGR